MSDYKLFEQYLSGKLSDNDRTAFENRLNGDAEFKKAFESHKTLQQAFDLVVEDDVKQVIDELEKKKKFGLGFNSHRRGWLSLAASFLILVTFLCFINPEPSGIDIVKSEKESTSNRSMGNHEKDISAEKLKLKKVDDYFTSPITLQKMRDAKELIQSMDKGEFNDLELSRLDWATALVEVGIDKPSGKKLLEAIANNESHRYNRDAKRALGNWSFFKRLLKKFSSSD